MPQPFTRTFRVRWSETDANGLVGPAQYLHYLVETAYDWGASAGLGLQDSLELGLAWVIRETEFHFHKPLQYNDSFEFKIWMVEWRRVRGSRAFELRMAGAADLVALGVQQVVALDAATLRPVRVPDEKIAAFRLPNPRRMSLSAFPQAADLGVEPIRSQRQIEWRDLDMLAHLNNAVSLQLAMQAGLEALSVSGWDPARMRSAGLFLDVTRLHIRHLAPAGWGDRILLDTYQVARGERSASWVITMAHEAESAEIGSVVLDWRLVDSVSGEARPLPPELTGG